MFFLLFRAKVRKLFCPANPKGVNAKNSWSTGVQKRDNLHNILTQPRLIAALSLRLYILNIVCELRRRDAINTAQGSPSGLFEFDPFMSFNFFPSYTFSYFFLCIFSFFLIYFLIFSYTFSYFFLYIFSFFLIYFRYFPPCMFSQNIKKKYKNHRKWTGHMKGVTSVIFPPIQKSDMFTSCSGMSLSGTLGHVSH